ncbi:PAS domain-containing protein [Roseomonas sp. GCM10028921]
MEIINVDQTTNAGPPGTAGAQNSIPAVHSSGLGAAPKNELPRDVFQAMHDSSSIGLCLIGSDLRYISVNERRAAMNALPVEAYIGRTMGEVVPDLAAQAEPALRKVLAGDEIDAFTVRLGASEAPEGERVFLVSFHAMWDCDGASVSGVLESWTDISARSHAWTRLQECEERYRHLIELSPFMPWTADADGMTLEFSPRFLSITGLSHEESIGQGWTKAVHPADLPSVQGIWSEAVNTGRATIAELRVRLLDGSWRWRRAQVAPRHDESGRIIRWYGTLEDIHDRKSAEEALRENEAFSRSVLDNSPDCVKVTDLDGRLLFMSSPGLSAMEIDDFQPLRGQAWVGLVGKPGGGGLTVVIPASDPARDVDGRRDPDGGLVVDEVAHPPSGMAGLDRHHGGETRSRPPWAQPTGPNGSPTWYHPPGAVS